MFALHFQKLITLSLFPLLDGKAGPRNHEVVLQPSLLVSPDPHNFNPSDDVLVEELEQGQAGKMGKLEIGKFGKSTKPLEDACPVVLFKYMHLNMATFL